MRHSLATNLQFVTIFSALSSGTIIAQEAQPWISGGSLTVGASASVVRRDDDSSNPEPEHQQSNSVFTIGRLGTINRTASNATRIDANIAESRSLTTRMPTEARSAGFNASSTLIQPRFSLKAALGIGRKYWRTTNSDSDQFLDPTLDLNLATSQTSSETMLRYSYAVDPRHNIGMQAEIVTLKQTNPDQSTKSADSIIQGFLLRQHNRSMTVTAQIQQNLSFIGPYRARQNARGVIAIQIQPEHKWQVGLTRGRAASQTIDQAPQWQAFWGADIAHEYKIAQLVINGSIARAASERTVSRTMTITDLVSLESKWNMSVDDFVAIRAFEERESLALTSKGWSRESNIFEESVENFTLGRTRQIKLTLGRSFGRKWLPAVASEQSALTTRAWQAAIDFAITDRRYDYQEVTQSARAMITRYF